MKIGIFLSRCEGIVGTSLDLESLVSEYGKYSVVKILEDVYDPSDFDTLLEDVKSNTLEGIILAGDSMYAHRQRRNGSYLFDCLAECGINPNRIEIVNLKNMVALPHQTSQDALQRKAKIMIDVGIEKIKNSGKLATLEIAPRKSVAIIGANLGSMVAAQRFLDAGCKVFLIHEKREPDLPPDEAIHVRPTWVRILRNSRFQLFPGSAIDDFYGFIGDYTLKIHSDGKNHELQVGAVVLSIEDNESLIQSSRRLFHVDMSEDGRLVARDEISAGSEGQDRGIFLINRGIGNGDDFRRKFMEADAAAAALLDLLNRNEIHHTVTVSQVYKGLCSGCGACVKTCAFHAVSLQGNPPVSVIDPRKCRGCGNCVTACPSDARDLTECPSIYLFNAIEIMAGFDPGDGSPRVLFIACDGCGYRCMDHAAEEGQTWPVGVMPLWVRCGGQIDTQLIMHAFAKGFEGVGLVICGEGCCHNIVGNVALERRVNLFREILFSRGIDSERMAVISTCAREGEECVDKINKFYRTVVKAMRTA